MLWFICHIVRLLFGFASDSVFVKRNISIYQKKYQQIRRRQCCQGFMSFCRHICVNLVSDAKGFFLDQIYFILWRCFIQTSLVFLIIIVVGFIENGNDVLATISFRRIQIFLQTSVSDVLLQCPELGGFSCHPSD